MQDIFGIGTLTLIRGSILYAITGHPIQVQLRAPISGSCTSEVPVTAYFANSTEDVWCDPYNYIIKKKPVNITCDE